MGSLLFSGECERSKETKGVLAADEKSQQRRFELKETRLEGENSKKSFLSIGICGRPWQWINDSHSWRGRLLISQLYCLYGLSQFLRLSLFRVSEILLLLSVLQLPSMRAEKLAICIRRKQNLLSALHDSILPYCERKKNLCANKWGY